MDIKKHDPGDQIKLEIEREFFNGPPVRDPHATVGEQTVSFEDTVAAFLPPDVYVPKGLAARGLGVKAEVAQGGPELVMPAQSEQEGPDPLEEARRSIEAYIKNHKPVPSVLEVKSEAGDSSRKDTNKTQGYWLIPQAPLAELARLYATGAAKYSPRGWEAGMEYSRVVDALYRHLGKYLAGERYDAVDGQHHMAAVAWAAFALMEYERTHPEFNNINPKD